MTDRTGVAEKLLQAEAVKLNIDNPFTWASGWKSPIYCDNRKLLSYPFIRDYVKSELCSVIFERFPAAEAIVGVATAGISWGAMTADQLKLPFLYARPKPKEHGLGNQLEGVFSANQKVVVIEDLISTGQSSMQVCELLKGLGMEVLGLVSIFDYGFPVSAELFRNAGIDTISLTDYGLLIELAMDRGLVHADHKATLLNWRQSPATWPI